MSLILTPDTTDINNFLFESDEFISFNTFRICEGVMAKIIISDRDTAVQLLVDTVNPCS